MQIYLNGWICLQPNCAAFWSIIEDASMGSHQVLREPDEAALLYDPRFLKQKVLWPNDNLEYPLKFNGLQISEHALPSENTSQSFWSGVVCLKCGCCNSK